MCSSDLVATDRVARAEGADAALAALVDWHVDFALRHRPLIVVQDRDWESLPRDARERVRSLQRSYVDVWAERMRERDADLPLAEARARAHAAFGLINSTPRSALLPDAAMRDLLAAMALAALDAAPATSASASGSASASASGAGGRAPAQVSGT